MFLFYVNSFCSQSSDVAMCLFLHLLIDVIVIFIYVSMNDYFIKCAVFLISYLEQVTTHHKSHVTHNENVHLPNEQKFLCLICHW